MSFSTLLVDLASFKLTPDIFEHKELFFIPYSAWLALEAYVDVHRKPTSFVVGALSIAALLLVNRGDVKAKEMEKRHREYKKILDVFTGTLINGKRAPYTPGVRPFKYMLSNLEGEWVFVGVGNSKVTTFDNRLSADHPTNNDMFLQALCLSTVDGEAAVRAEYEAANLRDHLFRTFLDVRRFAGRVNRLLRFMTHRYAASSPNVRRVYSSFTELSRVSRKFVLYMGKPFTEVDVANCQPTMLAAVLLNRGLPVDGDYIKHVNNSTFYESIMEEAESLGVEGEMKWDEQLECLVAMSFKCRDDVKELSYSRVFFKLNPNSQIAKIFRSLWPLTYSSLEGLQEEGVAAILQRAEADCVLPVVPGCPYFNVHDAGFLSDAVYIADVIDGISNNLAAMSGGQIKASFKVK